MWVYYRFALSFRDIEELLASRDVIVSYEAIRLWCGKFGPEYARKLRQVIAISDLILGSSLIVREGVSLLELLLD